MSFVIMHYLMFFVISSSLPSTLCFEPLVAVFGFVEMDFGDVDARIRNSVSEELSSIERDLGEFWLSWMSAKIILLGISSHLVYVFFLDVTLFSLPQSTCSIQMATPFCVSATALSNRVEYFLDDICVPASPRYPTITKPASLRAAIQLSVAVLQSKIRGAKTRIFEQSQTMRGELVWSAGIQL